MTQRDRNSLAWSLNYAARRLEGAFALAAPCGVLGPYVLAGVWRAACRELYYLELFVRRLLVCMAGEMAVALRAMVRDRVAETCADICGENEPSGDHTDNKNKVPLFPVFDRQPSEKALQDRLKAMAHWAGEARPQNICFTQANTRGAPAPVRPAARLAARFAALADVLDNPERHARRLARWRARRAAAGLRLGALPALARGGPLDLARSSYFEAERLALLTLNAGWDGTPEDAGPDPP